jgi:cellulose synthase/poly-beta-1,6-N-acetylglucosamine synthase-like glycosyltransferase
MRTAMAQAAFYDVLGKFGPEARVEAVGSIIEQIGFGGRRGARAFELALDRAARPPRPYPHVPSHEVLFKTDRLGLPEVTVIVPLYNYARFVLEALDSVREQTLAEIDLIVIDDASTDDSQAIAKSWLAEHHQRFNRAMLVQNTPNAGLAFSRNVGFALAETAYVLPLDADNLLMPRCAELCLETIKRSGASYVYPQIQHFGDSRDQIGLEPYEPVRLVPGNYIDAMALVRKSAWVAVGGYERQVKSGWEDFDFWCKMVEQGGFGERSPEVLAGYRVHAHSMLHYETNVPDNKVQLIDQMQARHPWLQLR